MGSEEIVSQYIFPKENVPCSPIPLVLCIVVIVVVAGEGRNPENENECSVWGCSMAAVVAGRKGTKTHLSQVVFVLDVHFLLWNISFS